MKAGNLIAWVTALLLLGSGAALAQDAPARNANARSLFVGTNYQPVDRSPQEIHGDIALMKSVGFTVVRMGDLSWDYFEPSEASIISRRLTR